MSNPASRSELSELHATVARVLKDRLDGEEVSAADISAAIRFLKDNNIESNFEVDDDALSEVKNALDNFDDDDTVVALRP